MKSYEKPFFVKIMRFFWSKMVHFVIEKYFSLFVKWFEDLIFLIADSLFNIARRIKKSFLCQKTVSCEEECISREVQQNTSELAHEDMCMYVISSRGDWGQL